VRGGGKVAIINHPDVRRMLMNMRCQVEATRALAYVVGAAHDAAVHHPDPETKKQNQAFVDLMIPVVKGWSTEVGIDVASTGVQVHGGMGFIEETGAAQHLRDVRISTIYEGTTGIQANDLIGRKMAREGGATIKAVIGMMRQLDSELAKQGGEHFVAIRARFTAGINELEKAATWIVENYGKDVRATSVGAVPFLWLFGIVAGGWQMARAALVAQARIDGGDQDPFFPAKIITTRFFADHQLTRAAGLAVTVMDGAAGALALEESMF
jgi:3-(methylthio)propanoyl-CoA dehydrogenase